MSAVSSMTHPKPNTGAQMMTVSTMTKTPRNCLQGHMSTGSSMSPSQTMHLVSLMYSLQDDLHPQILSEGETSTVSRVTPPSRPYPCHRTSRVRLPPTPCNYGRIFTVSRVTSPLRPCTWGHMCILSRVIAPPRPCNWVKSPQSQG